MPIMNMHDAKTKLSQLVEAIETGKEPEIIIARNGRPVARLVPLAEAAAGPRIGIAKGLFAIPDDFDADDSVIAEMFNGGRL